MKELQLLLDKLEVIKLKIETLNKEQGFNVFSALYKSHDEVRLHSRFLFSLINVKTNPKLSGQFLKSFLDQIGLSHLQNEPFETYREYENIDLLLKSREYAVIIENKVYAKDQQWQLLRYYNTLIKDYPPENIHIYYLTLDGKPPSMEAFEGEDSDLPIKKINLEDIQLISYGHEIREWISHCMKEAVLEPSLREPLSQYLKIINLLTQLIMNEQESIELYKLLSSGDNMVNAALIQNNWNEMKALTEEKFWDELEDKLKQKGKIILEHQKWSREAIHQAKNSKKQNHKWYGIMYQVANIKSSGKITIYIERGQWSVLFGITSIIIESRSVDKLNTTLLTQLRDQFKNTHQWTNNNVWIAVSNPTPDINFEAFSSENTLRLSQDAFRANIINSIIEEMESWEEGISVIVNEFQIDKG